MRTARLSRLAGPVWAHRKELARDGGVPCRQTPPTASKAARPRSWISFLGGRRPGACGPVSPRRPRPGTWRCPRVRPWAWPVPPWNLPGEDVEDARPDAGHRKIRSNEAARPPGGLSLRSPWWARPAPACQCHRQGAMTRTSGAIGLGDVDAVIFARSTEGWPLSSGRDARRREGSIPRDPGWTGLSGATRAAVLRQDPSKARESPDHSRRGGRSGRRRSWRDCLRPKASSAGALAPMPRAANRRPPRAPRCHPAPVQGGHRSA